MMAPSHKLLRGQEGDFWGKQEVVANGIIVDPTTFFMGTKVRQTFVYRMSARLRINWTRVTLFQRVYMVRTI